MSVIPEVERLLGEGREADAVMLVEQAAAAGDGDALLRLANWRLYALHGPRDLDQVHNLLERAGAAGETEAVLIRSALTACGVGVAEDSQAARALLMPIASRRPEAAAQLRVFDTPAPNPVAEAISDDPSVILVRNFLSHPECFFLCESVMAFLQPSSVIDPASGSPKPHPHRDSLDATFGPAEEDIVVRRINRRIAWLTESDPDAGEPLQILSYGPGQQYKLHHDAIPGADNQRDWTVLMWLNDDYKGGETEFPMLDIRLRGRAGDALIFSNLYPPTGLPDRRMRHAGLPVTEGRKWLGSRWVRQRAFSTLDELIG